MARNSRHVGGITRSVVAAANGGDEWDEDEEEEENNDGFEDHKRTGERRSQQVKGGNRAVLRDSLVLADRLPEIECTVHATKCQVLDSKPFQSGITFACRCRRG